LQKLTDVSDVITASIIREALMMEAVSITETLANFYETTVQHPKTQQISYSPP
jgi:hypothetical protein